MQIFKKLNYWSGKVRLAARFPFFRIALIIFAIGLPLNMHASWNMTPATVGVSGYYRSDGTYVNSYSRRPPDSRRHDAPYEAESAIASVLILIGGGGIILFFYRLCLLSDTDLLPKPQGLLELPKKIYIRRLSNKAKAKYNDAREKQRIREQEINMDNKKIIAEQYKKYYGIYPEEKDILFGSKKV